MKILPLLLMFCGCVGPATATLEEIPCSATISSYRVVSARLPTNYAKADRLAYDFNGDGKLDNALGRASVALHQFARDFDPSKPLADRLEASPWIVEVGRCIDRNRARVVFLNSAGRQQVVGTTVGATISASPGSGKVWLPLAWLVDSIGNAPAPGWVESSQVSLSFDESNLAVVRVTATIDARIARSIVLGPVAEFINYSPLAKWLRQAIDDDRDGSVTVAELQTSGSFLQLTAADLPDDRISLGIELSLEPFEAGPDFLPQTREKRGGVNRRDLCPTRGGGKAPCGSTGP